MENESEIEIIRSVRSSELYNVSKRNYKIVILIFLLFFFIITVISDIYLEAEGLFFLVSFISISLILLASAHFNLLKFKNNFENIEWIVTNKGLTEINNKSGDKKFIPANQINYITHVRGTISVFIVGINEPMVINILKNDLELKNALDNMIYETQKQKDVVIMKNENPVEEIRQFKELLDSGIITQEEFDKKKKELFNL